MRQNCKMSHHSLDLRPLLWLSTFLILLLAGCREEKQPSTNTSYRTNFTANENPISEGGKWLNGKAQGLDWADVAVTDGIAHGTESGTGGYDDSTAILSGTWGSDQSAEATVRSINQSDGVYEEVELRLRSSLSAHQAKGYEINFRCSKSDKAYAQIVRWNGPLGKFTYLAQKEGSNFGVTNGDVVKATIVGDVINAYINGVQILQTSDSTYTNGNPGMGFFLQGTGVSNSNFGFTK